VPQISGVTVAMPAPCCIKAGKLRPFALSMATAPAQLPDVPPVAAVVPTFEASGWYGVGAAHQLTRIATGRADHAEAWPWPPGTAQ